MSGQQITQQPTAESSPSRTSDEQHSATLAGAASDRSLTDEAFLNGLRCKVCQVLSSIENYVCSCHLTCLDHDEDEKQ